MVAGGVGVAAAVAVPNFLEAQTRSKVSRAKSDMRSMATAIESYYVDFNVYPPSTENPGEMYGNKPANADHFSTFRVMNPKQAMPLTTPIGYLTSSFFEPANSDLNSGPYGYFSEKDFWVVWTAGPDKKFDINPSNFQGFKFPITSEEIANQTYDPTNGTISAGDIWRVKQ
jgi:type II secretory pathway pseudopilin PulG